MNKDKRLLFDSPHKSDLVNESQVSPKFDISMTTGITCEKCGSSEFDRVYNIRKMPAVMTGTRDMVAPIPVFKCTKCGAILGQKPVE
jgi:DNA-directed RNA polymerase subunit RPC12/RpoP